MMAYLVEVLPPAEHEGNDQRTGTGRRVDHWNAAQTTK